MRETRLLYTKNTYEVACFVAYLHYNRGLEVFPNFSDAWRAVAEHQEPHWQEHQPDDFRNDQRGQS